MALILGIDPGSQKTGFGIISHQSGSSEYVTSGVIRLPRASLPERLKIIHDGVAEIIEQHCPQEFAIEEVFLARDAKAAIKLGQARGAAIVAAVNHGLPVFEYAAKSIKQAVVGTGSADKAQVQHMVVRLLKLPATPVEDAVDALAAAICHAHTQQALLRQARSRHRQRGVY
ncbi:MAG: crossover junction endodeoxyribonuclease RuvC [Halieaceae bacterium]|jgi:crossover junction endodeoxyribonuclease RuvC|nr:crossover junction endodeoxyribonuclease RuvC [Halieaceae bacterium]